MNRRQKIIVSVVGIFIVLLALVGITYGYFLTRIQGNTNTTSITVTTADLKLVYGDGNGSVSPSGVIMPDNNNYITFSNNTDTKTFTVTNDGNATVENYVVVVEDISVTYASNATLEDGTSVTEGQSTTFNRPEDFVYVLSCKAYTGYGTESQTELEMGCNGQETETVLPMEDSILVTNTIDKDVTHAYELKIKYLNPDIDQSKDMNKTFSLKVNIEDIRNFNPYKDGTLANAIFTNDKVKKNNISPVFNVSTSKEEGMYPAEDDYGISWYYRGAQQNNYVNFAGFTWRIVRINGDGSVRLVLNGTLDKVKREGIETFAGTVSAFNAKSDDNAYIGYMYGLTGVTNEFVCVVTKEGVKSIDTSITDEASCTGEWMSGYDATHFNLNDSIVKDNVDLFFETYLENGKNKYHYGEYLADVIFCGDKTIANTDEINVENNTGLGYGNNTTYYSGARRLFYTFFGFGDVTESGYAESTPTLKCAENATNTYSRYTTDGETTNKGIETNGDLTYPIALLSADEVVMAGGLEFETIQDFYLWDVYEEIKLENYRTDSLNLNDHWLMTPMFYDGSSAIYISEVLNSIFYDGLNASFYGTRPVINLRADILVDGGNGTIGSGAYTVKLPD